MSNGAKNQVQDQNNLHSSAQSDVKEPGMDPETASKNQVQNQNNLHSNAQSHVQEPGMDPEAASNSDSKLQSAEKDGKPPETSRYQLFVKAMTAKLKSEDPTCNQVPCKIACASSHVQVGQGTCKYFNITAQETEHRAHRNSEHECSAQ